MTNDNLRHSTGYDAVMIREVSSLEWLDAAEDSLLELSQEIEELTKWKQVSGLDHSSI